MLLLDGIEIEMDTKHLSKTTVLYTSQFHEDNSNPKFDHKDAIKTCFSKEVKRYFEKNAKNLELLGH